MVKFLRKYFISFVFLLSVNMLVYAQNDIYSFSHPADAKRFQKITQQIRCVVCQNQNIDESDAPLAGDLREKIYELMNAHWSDAQIKDYLVERYGEFILLEPPFNWRNCLLWGLPFVFLIAAFFILYRRLETTAQVGTR